MPGLVFNDVSGGQGLIQTCEDDLNFPIGGISGNPALLAQFTRRLNKWYQKIVTMIFASQDGWTWDDTNATDYPVAITNLVANQQDYPIPVSLGLLRIQRVGISYDGGATWNHASPFNKNQTGQSIDLTNIKNNFTIANPFYSLENNAFFIYPIPTANSIGGIKIWFQRGPLEFVSTDTTKQPGIDPAFHPFIAAGASADFAKIKSLPQKNDLMQECLDYEARLKLYYGSKDQDTNLQLTSSYNDTYGS